MKPTLPNTLPKLLCPQKTRKNTIRVKSGADTQPAHQVKGALSSVPCHAYIPITCRDIFIKFPRGGGGFEILDLFLNKFRTFRKKLWTFQYAAGFRGPGILIKRSTIVDLSLYAAWLWGPDISQNIQKIFKNYPKIDYRAFASSRRHYAADNRTARDIQNLGPFWVVKNSRGGNAPLAPLIKISLTCQSW